MRRHSLPLIVLMLAAASVRPTAAATHYVNVNGTNPVSPYTSWATAATNIQLAASASSSGDLVLVTNGIYQTGGNAATARLTIVPAITVQSVNGAAATIINGAGVMRCVTLSSGVKLIGFTLANGAAGTHSGGGVSCLTPDAFAANCIFTNNSATTGGGAQSGTFSNCTFIANVAVNYGGGAYGAAVYQCNFVSNTASYNGGGVFQSTLTNCSLTGNAATVNGTGAGGGAAQSTLVNCVLAGNRAGYIGGGAFGGNLFNCTVVSNLSSAYNAAVSGCTVNNSIVFYNTAYYTSTPTDDTGSSYFNNCCRYPKSSFELSNVNTVTNPPAFVNLAAGDFHLQPWSPCINAGTNSLVTGATDLGGNPRIVGGIVDIGAYEFQSPVRYVNISNTAPVSPFTNWITAATNIQDAVDVATASDFIVVSNGIYKTGGRAVYGIATNRVTVDRAVTVQSVNGPASTSIAGLVAFTTDYQIRCVYLTNGATLIGFTLTNGACRHAGDLTNEQSGGGAWCETGGVISNCIVTRNLSATSSGGRGGGIYGGTVWNSTIVSNSAYFGGGVAAATVFNCLITSNSTYTSGSAGGGGAYACTLSNCTLVANGGDGNGGGACNCTLLNSTLSNNLCWYLGGGAFNSTLTSCLLLGNSAGNGGGACSNLLYNCVLTRNIAQGSGGGAYDSTLLNCTVVSNTAASFGVGVAGGGVTNSIVYYNVGSATAPNYSSGVPMAYCCTYPLPTNGFGNFTNEPLFVNTNSDFHLQTNSPCINSGNNAYVTNTTDFDGNPRLVGGTVDLGAYEFQSPSSTISYAYLQQYGLPTDGSADNEDSDSDGFSNAQEWIAGTNPTNVASRLQLTAAAPTNNFSGTTIIWQSVNGVNYFVQRTADLRAPLATIATNLPGQTGTTSYTDPNATGSGPFFYRVGATR